MAYVGTPSRLGDARTTLASIIQGEAGGEGLRGMQAVAQVISNRANQNYSGYGSDLVSQATARMQFQGQATRISPQAYQVADQALAGQLPNVVGSGAVNYANPGDSSARWARNLNDDNSFHLGNHYFTDNTSGRAYQPDLTGSGVSAPMNSNNPTALTPSGTANGGMYSGIETSAGDGTIVGTYTNANGTPGVMLGSSGDIAGGAGGYGSGAAQTTGFDSTGGFTGANVAGGVSDGAFGLGGLTSGGSAVGSGFSAAGSQANPNGYSLDGATLDPSVNAGNISDPIVGYNAAGPVTANPTLVGATNSVASATAKGTKQIGDDTKTAGKTIGDSISGAAKTASAISKSWQDLGTDYFTRLVFIVVGLIALAAALIMFKPVQNAVSTVVPAARVAKVVRGIKGK